MKPTRKKATSVVRPPAGHRATPGGVVLLVGTRKGGWLFHGDAARRQWRVDGPHFLGSIVHHIQLDPRDRRTVLLAAKTGHLGPTVFRSTDLGKTWKEASKPPAFRKVAAGEANVGSEKLPYIADSLKARAVDHAFWLTPGHPSEPGAWYAGASPQGLFRSEDGGDTWEPVPGLNDDPQYRSWMGSEQDGTPDGPKLHSIIVDPRDPAHLYLAMSSGGVHESTNKGRAWRPLIKGLEVVDGLDAGNVVFHDPHCVRLSAANPDRLYQQNHCGIYRLDRPSDTWIRIGKSMPKTVGDIGFPIVLHPRDPNTAWVFPMDGTSVWPRVSVGGKPAAYVTRNAGKTWQRLDDGLPKSDAWFTVLRQAMSGDARDPVGLYFGTTSGELWASRNEGARWNRVASHLPHIYAVEAAER